MDNLAKPKFHTSDNLVPLFRELPDWLPSATRAYLAHTQGGASIRAVARATGTHPSTISRQVRRVESRREDPLVDRALDDLLDGGVSMTAQIHDFWPDGEDAKVTPEMAAVLGALAHPGTVLALARDLDKAVVVRDGPSGSTERLSVVDRSLATAMAMQDWIIPDDPENRIVRYRITPAGRVALRDFGPRLGLANTALPFDDGPALRRSRYGAADTPLMHLSRRKDVTGDPFLNPVLIRAGERLREDYELAQMDVSKPENWAGYIGDTMPPQPDTTPASLAHYRVAAALKILGAGLGDVALICCCELEGLEKAEKSLGWAARSGKIVLRIALTHLARHYEGQGDNAMIG